MRKTVNISFFILLIITAAGCTKEIDLKLNSTYTRLVVEGIITTDTMTHFVKLTKSSNFFSDVKAPGVTGANVTISDEHNVYTLTEIKNTPGYYFTSPDFYGIPGRTYSLEIENVDIDEDGKYESYSAESYLNPVTPVDSIKLEYEKNWDLWKILLYAKEPGDTINFYMFSIMINDSIYTDQLTEVTVADDRFVNGNYVNGVWVHSIYNEDEGLNFVAGDTVTLVMSGITEEFRNYIIALQDETRTNIPFFSSSPANLPGNISNGAIGYFTAFSNSYGSTIHTGKKE